ncbi:MAG: phosphoribosyl transferase [Chloroflexi bacterium]|nr:phosphoribosyl transferase [Chloroflexota bacterium]
MVTYFEVPQAIFDNRQDAGQRLAAELGDYAGRSAVVLAIPNGGVPVAVEVASALEADLDLMVVRKIPLPLNPEAGFGAIADDGTVILNEDIVRSVGLSRQQIEHEANKVRAEVKRRSLLYKGDRLPVKVSGRAVILVDDGLASGVTMTAAVQSVRCRHPGEIVVAAPCASAKTANQLETVADKVIVCASSFAPGFAVADFYRHWRDVSDSEVLRCLSRWKAGRPGGMKLS